jgi:hypothetical protein
MLFKSILAFILFTTTAAFSPMKPVLFRQASTSTTTTARNVIMTEEETMNILKKSEECIASECSIDEVDDLLSTLKGTEKELEDRLTKIINMIGHLQHINEKDGREKDEVRQFVKDMLRVFSHEETGFAMGFSGDIGDGPTTAYDALPPKPWKASE